MAERVLEYEGTFAFRCQTLNGRCKRIERCLAFRCSACWIRKIEEDTRAAATMKEEIDWRKELLASKKFNEKFSRNLLENGAKNYMQEIYMGYMYNRWRKIRDWISTTPPKVVHHVILSFNRLRGCHLNLTQIVTVFLSTTEGTLYHIILKVNHIYPPHFIASYSVNFKIAI